MRVLRDEATERKGNLEAGEMAVAISTHLQDDHREAHGASYGRTSFEPHAQAFIASYGQLNTAEDEGQIEAHNNLVKSCVACHMNFKDLFLASKTAGSIMVQLKKPTTSSDGSLTISVPN